MGPLSFAVHEYRWEMGTRSKAGAACSALGEGRLKPFGLKSGE